jgi:hypothetical protein
MGETGGSERTLHPARLRRPGRQATAHSRAESRGSRPSLAGVPLTYGKPGFKNDGFLARGRRAAG